MIFLKIVLWINQAREEEEEEGEEEEEEERERWEEEEAQHSNPDDAYIWFKCTPKKGYHRSTPVQ